MLEKKSQEETEMTLLEKEIEHLKTILAQKEEHENKLVIEIKTCQKKQLEEK